ncbi:MAG: CPBP family intramembrane metalloprotease [Lactobacillus sp.]|jgi:membrane protease YdiL (CAAX protease family)|nr:CPBP family intramembrane metalloprotease [Lactobacillus sp.]MCI2032641.1 CPBP family intramembrane metalloprotease [Lactobacillus sp.]
MSQFKSLCLHSLQFIGWLFVHNVMVLPVFAAALWLPNRGPVVQAALTIVCGLLGGLSLYWLNRAYGHALQDNPTGHFHPTRLTQAPLWQWVAVLALTAGWVLVQYFWPGQASADQDATASLLTQYPVPMFLVVSLLGPIYEELLSRGLFFAYFIRSGSRWAKGLGLVLSAFLFGLLHSTSFSWATAGYILSGFVLGGIYLLTRNVRFSILAHLVNNVIAVFL